MGNTKMQYLLMSVLPIVYVALAMEAPIHSMETVPQTTFTCRGKVNGAYYADVEAECQLYHVCARNPDGILEGVKFLCGNGTVFDQKMQVCQDFRQVICHEAPQHYKQVTAVRKKLGTRRRTQTRRLTLNPILEKETSFSCADKADGGYYADVEVGCQMFHVCSRNKYGDMASTKFLCGRETVFDQSQLVCQDFKKVRCEDAPFYYADVARLLEERKLRIPDEEYEPNPILKLETSFSCEDKINGGFYADVETHCQVYHICSRDKDGALEDIKFVCGDGTVFDQRRLVCQDFRRVRCQDAPKFYKNRAAILARRVGQNQDRRLLASSNVDIERRYRTQE